MQSGRNVLSTKRWPLPFCAAAALLLAPTPAGARAAQADSHVDFNRDIRPILSENCFACHGPDKNKRKSGLRLDTKEGAYGAGKSEKIAIVPGKPDKSELMARLTSTDEEQRMPPPREHKTVTPPQVALLKRWIASGAPYDKHWAFKTIQAPPVPGVGSSPWATNEIDRFILARLDQEHLTPSPPEGKERLIRRATLDLTGLPPTLAEVDAFANDRSPAAFETVVDRLLASPHFGERMAVPWLDLARFADTAGYHNDSLRDMWLWRDWVVKAFNANKPFSDFTVEQLAGDLIPKAGVEQKVASGFHRNVMTSDEGGLIDAEYLNLYVVDRVNTTGTTWLGMTVGCAQCHDHKYDPLLQREYYRLYAFFHNVPENGKDGVRDRNPKPYMKVSSPEQAAALEKLTAEVAQAEKELAESNKRFEPEFRKWLVEEPNKPKPAEPEGQVGHFTLDSAPHGTAGNARAVEGRLNGTGATFQSAGFIGGALSFDTKGHLEAGNTFGFERTQPFSAAAWVRLKNNGTGHLFGKLEAAPRYRGWRIEMTDRRANIQLISTWDGNAIEVRSKEQLAQDAWLHVLVTYDGSGKAAGISLYVNGKPAKLDVRKNALKDTLVSDAPFTIGGPQNGGLSALVDDLRIFNRALSQADSDALVALGWRSLLDVPETARTPEQARELKSVFRTSAYASLAAAEKKVAAAKQDRDTYEKAIPNTMVMEEMATPRDTFVKTRGAYDKNGEKVAPGVPEFLPPLGPAPDGKRLTRYDLANWLISPEHPLTSRVAVNRLWAILFGTGIVRTLNDFGMQGDWPSHPDLLEWLAADFMRDWNMKRAVRQIMLSSTYRQSSQVRPALLEKDSGNRLLARGPRHRLDAEFVRDNALAVSGLLNPEMGGKGVLPAQPPGIWEVNEMGGQGYKKSAGAAQYRRGIYVYFRRSTPYPSFLTFDAPNREFCTATRPRTSTPLQSLVLMNDPVYVEAARAFALRTLREGGAETAGRLSFMWRTALSRPPTREELAVLQGTLDRQLANYRQDRKSAEAFVKIGDLANPKDIDVSELAAWTALGSVILNLNETITN